MTVLRPYRPDDLEALYQICLVTGDSGADATALHSDPQLIGHIYSAPYGVLEPDHVIVAEDEDGVAGYIVGTYDTNAFAAKLERDWWPDLRERYRKSADLMPADRGRIATILGHSQSPADLIATYPAHIHMNLLTRLRGQRIGTRLLESWIKPARAAGVSGIHLGANASNAGGMAFWTRSGFIPLRSEGTTVWFGMQI